MCPQHMQDDGRRKGRCGSGAHSSPPLTGALFLQHSFFHLRPQLRGHPCRKTPQSPRLCQRPLPPAPISLDNTGLSSESSVPGQVPWSSQPPDQGSYRQAGQTSLLEAPSASLQAVPFLLSEAKINRVRQQAWEADKSVLCQLYGGSRELGQVLPFSETHFPHPENEKKKKNY